MSRDLCNTILVALLIFVAFHRLDVVVATSTISTDPTYSEGVDVGKRVPSMGTSSEIYGNHEWKNVSVILTRIIYINDTGIYLSYSVGYPVDVNVSFTIPGEAKVVKLNYSYENSTRILVLVFCRKVFRSLKELPEVYVVVNGTKIYPPPPSTDFQPTGLRSLQGREIYESISRKVVDSVLAITIVWLEEPDPNRKLIGFYVTISMIVVGTLVLVLIAYTRLQQTRYIKQQINTNYLTSAR